MPALNHAFTVARKHALNVRCTLRAVSYGERLKEALTLSKKVRRELAASLGVTVQAVGQIINSPAGQLTAENSARAARFLNVDHHWLATGEGEPRPRPSVSPMALDLAKLFDAKTPLHLRDMVYAQVVGIIDLSARSSQQSASPAAPAPIAPPPRG